MLLLLDADRSLVTVHVPPSEVASPSPQPIPKLVSRMSTRLDVPGVRLQLRGGVSSLICICSALRAYFPIRNLSVRSAMAPIVLQRSAPGQVYRCTLILIKMLSCGHSFCMACLDSHKPESVIACSVCNKICALPESGVRNPQIISISVSSRLGLTRNQIRGLMTDTEKENRVQGVSRSIPANAQCDICGTIFGTCGFVPLSL